MLMNFLLFDGIHSKVFNANFISKFSQKEKRFCYYIQKLIGIEIEDEDNPESGKHWVVYINDGKIEWDEVCEKEITIKPNHKITFQFE